MLKLFDLKSIIRRRLLIYRRLAIALAAALTLGAGCVPLTPPPPFHFLETAEALPKGEVSVTAAAGAGGGVFDATAVGGGARVRVGVGGGNEIGVEGTAAFVHNPQDDKNPKPWFGDSGAYGYKLSWKYSPKPWFAVEAGFGGSASATGDGVGGDLALLFSRSRGLWRPYVGTRTTIGVPVNRPANDSGGITPGLVVAGGLAIVPRDDVRIYLETGMLVAASQDEPDMYGQQDWVSHVDGYGGLGIELRFGRPKKAISASH